MFKRSLRSVMRTVYYRRNCISYISTIGVFSFLLTLYVWGLKQNKQTAVSFNLKASKFKRHVEGYNYVKGKSLKFKERTKGFAESVNAEYIDDPFEGQRRQRPDTDRGLDDRHDLEDKKRTDSSLHVYVVDEHHEVLPYWFGAANEGTIPMSGNTLVHIDGHSDMAPPENIPGYYPFFKWPKVSEIKYLMQSNDAFIQAAAMAGLINRVIWVFPDWDRENHDGGGEYIMDFLKLGWAHIERNGQLKREFCMCERNVSGIEQCNTFNRDIDEDNSSEMIEVPTEDCIIRKRLIYEEINERRALVDFSLADMLAKNEQIILDIDEDYFGCSYAIDPILKSNLSMSKLERLDNIVSANFCPVNNSQDIATDDFLMKLISTIKKKTFCTSNTSVEYEKLCRDIKKLDIQAQFLKKLQTLVESQTITFCGKDSFDKFLSYLIGHLSKLTIIHLRAIEAVGFCCTTSPKAFVVSREERRFSVCSGANTPENSAIFEHTPSLLEVNGRSLTLKNILKKISNRHPGLVTVSRSMRDGYTPRKYFETIEKSILLALNMTMDKPLKVHYDIDLLGGIRGWPSKHKT